MDRVSQLVGIDGRAKMRESLNNFIYLGDKSKTLTEKVMRVYAYPTSIHSTHPDHMEGNPVFIYLDAFNPDSDEVKNLKDIYQADRMGDVEMKRRLVGDLNSFLDPIREKRAYYQCHTGEVEEAFLNSTRRAKRLAEQTMSGARAAIGTASYLN